MNPNDTLIAPALKVCKKCKQSKPITEFYLSKPSKNADWRNATCSACDYAQRRAWLLRKRGEPAPFVDLPLEEWRSIPGYEGRYDVSNLGRVRSWCIPRGRLAVPRLKEVYAEPKDGYFCVALYENRTGTTARVSRLILMAFVGIPKEGMEASHLDGDHTNNALSNLAWETHQQNEDHKIDHGTRPRGEKQHASKLTEDQVREIRWLRQCGYTLAELAERFGIVETGIYKICKRETWKHVT